MYPTLTPECRRCGIRHGNNNACPQSVPPIAKPYFDPVTKFLILDLKHPDAMKALRELLNRR